MMSRKSKTLAGAAAVLLTGGGYFIYSLMAAQGQGVLAQQPLNTVAQTPPAFIMAVDDSNSMTFERMFPGGDGRMQWNSTTKSFFKSAGVFSNVGVNCANGSTDCYLYLYPHAKFNDSYSPGDAIPPLDIYGFARSHVYNASYFNPGEKYEPWLNANGSKWKDADPAKTLADPRSGQPGNAVVYDLTVNRAATGELFQFVDGMSIPDLSGTGTSYYVNSWWDPGWKTAAVSNTGTNTYAIQYFPATFYLPESAAAPTGYKTDGTSRPLISGACGPGCSMYRYQIKSGNYSSDAAFKAAQQNFANWFQYHRNRLLAMVGSSSHAMVDVNNMKVGYFTINSRTAVTMYDMSTEKTELYKQIYKLAPNGGTPNRLAVDFLGKQFRRTDDKAPVQLACQKNGGMLFTDGYTNKADKDNTPSTSYGNVDKAWGGAPFEDAYSETIADIAAAYYSSKDYTPLRSGTAFPAGQVPVSSKCATLDKSSPDWKRLDCQADLHMNFYGVTLGAQGRIYGNQANQTKDPYTYAPDWNAGSNPTTVDDGNVIDEIWHAAINSRGEYINAQTPAQVTDAMRRVLSAVAAGSSPSGTLALTGARIGAGSLTVTPSYDVTNDNTDWSSRLTASKVSVNAKTQQVEYTAAWEASSAITSAGRNIVMNKAGTLADFSSGNLTLEDLCGKPSGLYPGMLICTVDEIKGLGADVGTAVNYLRGDSTKEVRRSGGIFRDRGTPLGDIVNSTPVISSPQDDYGFRQLGGDYSTGYATYLTSKAKNGKYMVYVGANDGMLHAFDGGMAIDGTLNGDGGKEKFAYVPATSLGHMGNLLFPYKAGSNNQKFQHRYFVDGPVTVSDSYYGKDWHTTLVGTSGAGGRSVFALDVTNPNAFGTDKVLWEISDVNTSLGEKVRENIGHVLGKPVIVPVRSGTDVVWKAIFGNGYGSASGKAVLFVVDLATGTTNMIEAAEASTAISGKNGLGNIVVIDRWRGTGQDERGRDGAADTVYAADQRGALWKFDLTSSATSVDTPVFTTATHAEGPSGGASTYRQPITGGLAVATGRSGGVMLFFGTGSFSFMTDTADFTMQSMYGVNDVSGKVPNVSLDPSNLVPYSVVTTDLTRSLTQGTAPVGSSGWAINLPTGLGERFVGNPTLVSGILFLPTYVPNQKAVGCSTTGSNWLFALESLTGAGAMSQMRTGSPTGTKPPAGTAGVALDTGGTAPVKDVSVVAIPRSPEVPACWMAIGVSGGKPMYAPYPCGRQSWRQVK
ncbi:hypothetical protein D3C81_495930 [compost metagenome]|uniref:pilus assembly protein n=1 Tax=Stenotrophomonas TaxID=40323 RepID=UPI000F9B6612|nr:PilC/PilY family type IV pilus protein [Stenotrophomonas sp. PA-6-5C]MCF5090008.1 pilus assembly protein [Stenotrophomonas sp. PA-6-5C]